ncbi:MAG: hypothetical protein GY929_05595 [Actinomycetia bacterium]|nr:hypothetical protein [Actinomycetes bacterium]
MDTAAVLFISIPVVVVVSVALIRAASRSHDPIPTLAASPHPDLARTSAALSPVVRRSSLPASGAVPALPAPNTRIRPAVGLTGTGLACFAVTWFFGGLLGVYLSTRAAYVSQTGDWFPGESTIDLAQPNVMALTLVMASFTIAWSVFAIARDDRLNTYLSLAITMLLGVAYINQAFYLLNKTGLALNVGDGGAHPAAVLLYVVGVSHIALLAAALIFALIVMIRALGGDYSSHDREGVLSSALFFHVTVAIYMVIWYAVYITK